MDSENNILETLGTASLLDEDNHPVLLSSLWQDQRAVLIFVRHFG